MSHVQQINQYNPKKNSFAVAGLVETLLSNNEVPSSHSKFRHTTKPSLSVDTILYPCTHCVEGCPHLLLLLDGSRKNQYAIRGFETSISKYYDLQDTRSSCRSRSNPVTYVTLSLSAHGRITGEVGIAEKKARGGELDCK